jgi:hypothetical protein
MSVNDNQAARNHYWNLTHTLPAEVMGKIELLILNYGHRLEYGLDMQPSKEQVLAKVRERFGDKAVDIAAQMPWMNTH